jgi:hypothetical protein
MGKMGTLPYFHYTEIGECPHFSGSNPRTLRKGPRGGDSLQELKISLRRKRQETGSGEAVAGDDQLDHVNVIL